MVFIINSPFKMPYTKYVLNRGFCPFYFITHEIIFLNHGNGTTITYTALGTKMNRFHNFYKSFLTISQNTIKGHFCSFTLAPHKSIFVVLYNDTSR